MNHKQHSEEFDLKIEGATKKQLKRNAFQIPEGYFENATPRIMEVVRASENKPADSATKWLRLLVPSLGIAAIAIVAVFMFKPSGKTAVDFDKALASVSIEELYLFAEFETEELLAYDLVEYEYVESEIGQREVIDYLLDEDINLYELEEELDI